MVKLSELDEVRASAELVCGRDKIRPLYHLDSDLLREILSTQSSLMVTGDLAERFRAHVTGFYVQALLEERG